MENKIITRDKPATLDKKISNKKTWNLPTVKEFKIEKNTNAGLAGNADAAGWS